MKFLIISLTFTFAGILQDLELKALLEDKVQILMPKTFELMSEDLLKQKYPSNNRPTIVYTDPTGSINLAVNHTMNQITSEQLPEALPVFVNQFQNLYPAIKWHRKDMDEINGNKFAVMEFITPAIDTEIYNLMFITELEGRLLMFSFNCPKQQEQEWKSTANEMMASVTINN